MLCVIFFSGVGGNHRHYIRVPGPKGEGHVNGVQGGGSGGGEFKIEEIAHFCYRRDQHTKEKAKVLADNLRDERQLTLEKDEQL